AITKLGRKLELTSGGATRLVDRLEEAGYVERIPCPTDRRISWARLTASGLAALVTATKVHLDDLDHNLTSQLSGEDMDNLDQVLSRLLP
ncbi:MAG: MarR family transcriptional regulator, partial [Actinobacteria bacterium]|nr:MarR family transcriptional regulator [Actinomycetota bacterium]